MQRAKFILAAQPLGSNGGEPVKLRVKRISRDGKITIEFNQRLVVPDFEELKTSGRSMLSMSQVDVTSSILTFEYWQRSNANLSSFSYSLELTDWQPTWLEVRVKFTDPLTVSQDKLWDLAVINIINPYLFVSEKTGRTLVKGTGTMNEHIPRQVAVG